MNRRLKFVALLAGAAALALGGANLHAQRGGGGGASHGKPAGVGTAGQHGRPANPGNSGAHRPSTPGADHPAADNHRGKPTGTSGTNGRTTVSDQLTRNTNLTSRLQGLLPAGTDVQKAGAGFKNLGQFVAAVHVSHNLDIPFDTLKGKMTGSEAMSLGQAIHELKPSANADSEADNAERVANATIKDAGKS
jgi:hypothetical protein